MTLVEQDGRPGSDPARGDASIVDWSAAAQIAGRLARPGPQATRDELADLVEGLRDAAETAVPHVLDVTRMTPAAGDAAAGLGSVYVVDRARWARANTEIMASLTDGVTDALVGERGRVPQATALVGAAQVGSVLAVLSSRVLGQFDPYSATARVPAGPGRLVLVAPNVLQVERVLDLVPRDFRLWVCLHEETHRMQFTATPWLRGHVQQLMQELLLSTEMDASDLIDRLRQAGEAVADAVRGGDGNLLTAFQTPEQSALMDRVTAVMSLAEGHGDYVMDAVGPDVVPSVERIRSRFQKRRETSNPLDRIMRQLLGMDLKMKQYEEGASFVRQVVAQVGMAEFNKVWTSPETLPTIEEIRQPSRWIERVVRPAVITE